MNRVVHFEMPAQDAERVTKFYSGVFGWQMQNMGEQMGGYILATATGTDDKGQKFRDQRLRKGVGAGLWASAALFRISLMVAHGIGEGNRVHFGAGLTF